MSSKVIQFKLVSGEEIACEVVDFPCGDDSDFTIKNALILLRNSTDPTAPQYLFKPWIAMMEGDGDYISLASDKILALCEPTRSFMKEYTVAKTQLHNISKMRQNYYDAMDAEYIQNLVDELSDMFEDYGDASPEEKREMTRGIVQDSDGSDSTKGKILQFPKKDKDTLH